MSFCFAYITCANKREAEKIGSVLVEEQLAACVNIIEPMVSIYMWQGSYERDSEAILLAKTKDKLFMHLTEKVCGIHSYETPCILKIPFSVGNKSYQDFLEKNTI